MVKRLVTELSGGRVLAPPGLGDAPVMDLMCSDVALICWATSMKRNCDVPRGMRKVRVSLTKPRLEL